jgi:hypothetical protein
MKGRLLEFRMWLRISKGFHQMKKLVTGLNLVCFCHSLENVGTMRRLRTINFQLHRVEGVLPVQIKLRGSDQFRQNLA